MSGLLVKDYEILFSRKQTLIVFLIIGCIMGGSADGSFVIGYLTLLGTILAMSTIAYDDADNGMTFLMTLPVSRKTYVQSKYLFAAIVGMISWAAAILIMVVLNTVKGNPLDLVETMSGAIALLPTALIVLSLTIPAQLKFGAEKGRIFLAAAVGVCVAIAYFLGNQIEKTGKTAQFEKLLDGAAGPVGLIVLIVICLVVMGISIAISTKIMENKSF